MSSVVAAFLTGAAIFQSTSGPPVSSQEGFGFGWGGGGGGNSLPPINEPLMLGARPHEEEKKEDEKAANATHDGRNSFDVRIQVFSSSVLSSS